MANGKTTFFYSLLIAIASLAVGMVLASRLDLSPASAAQTLAAPPMNSAPITGTIGATTFREIAERVSPAVVNIRAESRRQTSGFSTRLPPGFEGQLPPGLEQFFGVPQGPGDEPPPPQTVESAGSGFIVDESGLILTNNHVVEGTTRIIVTFYNDNGDREYEARVIGRDPLTDSALLELVEKPDHPLTVVTFGDSTQMKPGDWVMAIGNPFGYAHTVSVGVISGDRPGELQVATGRAANVLQTDVAINPGNSGGPLLNVRGEVIGINTAIYTDGRAGGNIGIGFAIPSNSVREILPQLQTGKVTRGRIGVYLSMGGVPRDAVEYLGLKDRRGAVIEIVDPDGAAARAGLEIGDVIVKYNDQAVRGNNDLVEMVMATRPGTTVPITVVRNRREVTLSITPDELDLEAEARVGGGRARPQAPPTPEQTSRNFGITIEDLTPETRRQLQLPAGQQGAVVRDVQPDSPAARARLAPGDLIVRIGDDPVTNTADAERLLRAVPEGGTVGLRVRRGDQERFVLMTRN